MERQGSEQGKLSAPPLYPTEVTPNEIVGFENMTIFIQHLRICKSGTNAGEFPAGRLNKEIGPANRDKVAAILRELREQGFYPLGVDGRGKVVWGIVLKSESQRLFEAGLQKYQRMSMAQLQQISRNGYREIRDGGVIESPTQDERDFEEVFGR